jgi:PAS domain-containing protein
MRVAQLIESGQLDDLPEFYGTLAEDGHLNVIGLLANQEAIDAIPVGIYVIELDGTLIICNKAAINVWGRTPELDGSEKYCGSHILRYPDGTIMPHNQSPPRITILQGVAVRNADGIIERPDGTRLLALANIFPIHDIDTGIVIGAVNIIKQNISKIVPGLFY